jgi:ribosome biogenesis GTPase A
MKNRLVAVFLLLTAALIFGGCSANKSTNKEVSLEVLNPMGVIEPEPTLALRPRLSDLAGKKIALVNNIKPGVPQLFDVLEELLKQKYPGVTVLRGYKPGPMAQAQEEHFQQIAKECNAFIYAMGD